MIEIIEIGQTFERRPILLAKISLKNSVPGITKRAIFIEAGKKELFLESLKSNIDIIIEALVHGQRTLFR